jgi:hypothetical protein
VANRPGVRGGVVGTLDEVVARPPAELQPVGELLSGRPTRRQGLAPPPGTRSRAR